jgi:hypothetical protein
MLQLCGVPFPMPSLKLWYAKLMKANPKLNKWVKEPMRWYVMLFFAFAPVLFYRYVDVGKGVKWHSTLLQLAGLVLVGKGLLETADRFGRPMPWVRVVTWWRPNTYKTAKLNMNLTVGIKATPEVSYQVNRKAPPSVEERLEQLERHMQEVRDGLQNVRTTNAALHDAANTRLETFKVALDAEIKKAMTLLEKQFADGLDDGYIGLFWVAFGTVLSGVFGS